MGLGTEIQWTEATMNFWIGCTHAGPGCDDCYADARDKRWEGGEHWGKGAPRRRTAPANWRQPYKWDRIASERGRPMMVFVSSLSDFFDKEIDPVWRAEAWDVIRDTPNLRYQITTKRIGLAPKMLPPDWGPAYSHVGFLATMVNQVEWNRDADKLIRMKDKGARWIGVSVEPMLGAIDFGERLSKVDWIIFGGESRNLKEPRAFDLDWAMWGIVQCYAAGAVPFVKQLGDNPIRKHRSIHTAARAGRDWNEWPEELRHRNFPAALLT